jgi:hypothetical protein
MAEEVLYRQRRRRDCSGDGSAVQHPAEVQRSLESTVNWIAVSCLLTLPYGLAYSHVAVDALVRSKNGKYRLAYNKVIDLTAAEGC